MSQCVPLCIYPAWNALHFLDLVDCFLSHVREIFSYYLFKYFLKCFLSVFFFWDPYNVNTGAVNIVPEISYTVSMCEHTVSLSSVTHLSVSGTPLYLYMPHCIFIIRQWVALHCISICAHTVSLSSVTHLSVSGTPSYLCVCTHCIFIICQWVVLHCISVCAHCIFVICHSSVSEWHSIVSLCAHTVSLSSVGGP